MLRNNQSHFYLGFQSPFAYKETQKSSTLAASKNNNRKCLLLVILFICILSLTIGVILAMVLQKRPAGTPTALNMEVNTNGLPILLTIDPANNTDAVNEILNNPELLIPGLAQAAGINANVVTEMTTVMGIEMTLETTYKDAAQLVQTKFKEWLEKSVKKKIVEELNVSSSRIIISIEKKESRIINIIVKISGTKPDEPSYEESATALTTLVKNGVLNLPGYNDLYSIRLKRDTNKWKVIQRIKVIFLFIDYDLLHFEDLVKALSSKIKDKTMTLGVESPNMRVLALSYGSTTITEVKEMKGCHLNRCLNQGVCLNAVDVFYKCICNDGYTGNNCETDIDECASFPCQNGGTCNDQTGGFICTCLEGWNGTQCDNNIDDCASLPCMNIGTCTDHVNQYTCTCMDGWNGRQCENNINECASSPCIHDGTCNDHVNKYTCTCMNGWQGRNCGIDTNECASTPCLNDGTCNDKVDAYSCTCAPGLEGDHCQNNTDECASSPCQNNGTCNDQVNGYNCTCEPGWEADHCQNNTDECAGSPCQNNGTCSDMVNGYNCTCEPGWEGVFCEINTDECASNPCKYDGTCNDMINGYNCTCTLGPYGDFCQMTPAPGTLLATCDRIFPELRDVTETNTGQLLVSGYGGVSICSLSGDHTSAEAMILPGKIYSAVQTSTGELWVIVNDGSRVRLYKKLQNGIWRAINNNNFNPLLLRLDQDENLILINYNINRNIIKFNITSELIMDTIISNRKSFGAIPLNASSILVSFLNGDCAVVLHWDGSPPTTNYGTCGQQGSSGGLMNKPYGVAVDTQGRVVIAEYNNKQVSVFDDHGTFIRTFLKGKFRTGPRSVLITHNNLLVIGEENSGLVKTFWMGQEAFITPYP